MKTIATSLFLCVFIALAPAQVNFELISQYNTTYSLRDIWGYVAPDGNEYALIGSEDGVYIFDMKVPESPQLITRLHAGTGIWVDIKTFGHYAYAVGDEGLLIIDLSDLPEIPNYTVWKNESDPANEFNKAHNLFIDEYGFAYLSSTDLDYRGVAFLDLATDPENPIYLGGTNEVIAHDVYARNNRLFVANGYSRQLVVFDVSDKTAPNMIGSQEVPGGYAHSVWMTADEQHLFVASEKPGDPISVMDIGDLSDIRIVDEFRPPVRPCLSSIPHNAFEKNGYLFISHYIDGCLLVDASSPDNLILVGQYDTDEEYTSGFKGAFGVYPFLPSGLVLVSDMNNGLFVLQPEFHRACYIEGLVRDKETGLPLHGVDISLGTEGTTGVQTDLSGKFKSGRRTAGEVEVTFRKNGYRETTQIIMLEEGKTAQLEADLQKLRYPGSIKLTGSIYNEPLQNAEVIVEGSYYHFSDFTDENGVLTFPTDMNGSYTIYINKWGWKPFAVSNPEIPASGLLAIEMESGYGDLFISENGWEVSGTVEFGHWTRGIPSERADNYCETIAPTGDSPEDIGNYCFITGNRLLDPVFHPDVFYEEVKNGETVLISPVMLIDSLYAEPALSYSTWFANMDWEEEIGVFQDSSLIYSGNVMNPADDELLVFITNGRDTVLLETIDENHEWRRSQEFKLADLIELTNEMQVIFQTSDTEESPNYLKAAVDDFQVSGTLSTRFSPKTGNCHQHVQLFPNPFHDELAVNYTVTSPHGDNKLLLYNALGQVLHEELLDDASGIVRIGTDLLPGVYIVTLLADGELCWAHSVMKAR